MPSKLKKSLETIGVDTEKINTNKRPKQYNQPYAIEREYLKYLRSILNEIKFNLEIYLYPVLQQATKEVKEENKTISLDAYVDDLENSYTILENKNNEIAEKVAFSIAIKKISDDIDNFSKKNSKKVIESVIKKEPISTEPWLINKKKQFVSNNVALIKKLNQETLNNIKIITSEGLRKGLRHEEIKKQIVRKIGVGTLESSGFGISGAKRAALIARDQTSKFYGELNKSRQKNVGVNLYTWRTVQDRRVRGEENGAPLGDYHDVLEGMLCDWDDDTIYSDDDGKTWKKRSSIGAYIGTPGSDYNCRCTAEPYFKNLF